MADFDENQCCPIQGNDVDLAASAPDVAGNDRPAAFIAPLRRSVFEMGAGGAGIRREAGGRCARIGQWHMER